MNTKILFKIMWIAALSGPIAVQAASFCTKFSSRDMDLHCDIEETAMYLGVSAGHALPAAKSFNALESTSSNNSVGFMLGKRLTDTYAFETQYTQAGTLYDASSTNYTDVNVYSFTGVGRFPLDNGHYFSLYGKFGWGISYVTIQQIGSNWHGDLTYGAGAELVMGKDRNWMIRAGIDEYNTGALSVLVPGQPVPRDKLDNFSAALILNF